MEIMKQELDRIKSDLETMQKAMRLVPSMAREWVCWMKRDRWIGLLWCVPGMILIAGTLLPNEQKQKYLGLVTDQWIGILAAISLALFAVYGTWKQMGRDGRPEAVARETKRIYGCGPEGKRFGLVLVAQMVIFYFWGRQHHLSLEGFFTGTYVFLGSGCLIGAVVAKIWQGLAFAIPFLIYGFCRPLVGPFYSTSGRMLYGLTFIAVALLFSFIHAWQIRQVERRNESH
jgi:hypothetical protein